jgi:hypothetical protein
MLATGALQNATMQLAFDSAGLIVNGHKMGIHRLLRVLTCQVLAVIGASSYPVNEAIAPSVPSLFTFVRDVGIAQTAHEECY